MEQNIFLIGFMGCGKTTVARELNRLFGLTVIEMDQLIEEREGMSIPDIFAQKGEAYFRSCETTLLRELQRRSNLVVSCGGGVALREENVALMKSQGRIVLLTATPETILERVRDDQNRPVLNGKKTITDIEALLALRWPAYEKAADILVATDKKQAAELAAEIMR